MSSGFVEVDGTKLYYKIDGIGTPCIITSYLGALSYERMFSKNLRDHLKLIFNDLGGGGGESIPRNVESITLATLSDEMEALRRTLNLGKFILLGHSANVFIALDYVKRHPSKVSHLILIGGGPKSDSSFFQRHQQEYWDKHASEERRELLKNKLERLGDMQLFDDFPRWYEANTPKFWKDADFDTKPIFQGVKPNYDVLRHLFGNVFGEFDSTSYLTEITCPVLLMMGKYDFSNPPSLWDNYWKKFPDCTYHLLDDSGHNPMIEIPMTFDKLLIDWIKTH
ncbi:MAG: alpha/beta hydrolase [Candidatus Bathyarchaeota archaeon]|nr:alpha/beta hydrolase [Candidatus Bathyarchaeota archaeon]